MAEFTLTSTEYVRRALRFLSFCDLLPEKRNQVIAAPDFIGVLIRDPDLGESIRLHRDLLNNAPFRAIGALLEPEETAFGGEKGIALFRALGLWAGLLNNDPVWPIIYMNLPEPDKDKRGYNLICLKCSYWRQHKKELELLHWPVTPKLT